MPRYRLRHMHEPEDCAVAFAAWQAFSSPLSGTRMLCSCPGGAHELLAVVTATGPEAALEQLPPWVRARASAAMVREVTLPG